MSAANQVQSTRSHSRTITAEAPVTIEIPLPVLAGMGLFGFLALYLLIR